MSQLASSIARTGLACKCMPWSSLPGNKHTFVRHPGAMALWPRSRAAPPSRRFSHTRAAYGGKDPSTMDPFSDPYSDPFMMANDIEASVNAQIRKIEGEVRRDMEQTQREIEAARREIGGGGSSDVIVRKEQGSFYSRSYSMQRGNGYYMESYTEFRGPGTTTMLQPMAAGSGWNSAILGLAVLLAAAYSAVAMAFNKGYTATKFSEKPMHRWRLVLLWPILFLFSENFRKEFKAAMQKKNNGNEENSPAEEQDRSSSKAA